MDLILLIITVKRGCGVDDTNNINEEFPNYKLSDKDKINIHEERINKKLLKSSAGK